MKMACQHVVTAGLFMIAGSGVLAAQADDANSLSEEERNVGFELLFNGRNSDGWEHAGNWTIEDGALYCARKGGDITYRSRKVPDDFELRFQWKVAKGSNSGVYYRPGQYEYQILDNQVHADGKNPRTSAASLYFCMAPCCDATKPPGQWNTGRIICKGTVIQHWLNAKKVVDFDYADPKWAWNVELLRKRGADLAARGGVLYLQDHGDPVWYRGIKGRKLGPHEELDRTPVTPATIPEAMLELEQQKLQKIMKRRKQQAGSTGQKTGK